MGKGRTPRRSWNIADINLDKRVELGTILSLLQTHIEACERRHAALQLKSSMSSVHRGVAEQLRSVQDELLTLTGEI
jgi:hypothetical protein